MGWLRRHRVDHEAKYSIALCLSCVLALLLAVGLVEKLIFGDQRCAEVPAKSLGLLRRSGGKPETNSCGTGKMDRYYKAVFGKETLKFWMLYQGLT